MRKLFGIFWSYFFFFAVWLHLSVWRVINRNIKLTLLLFATCNSRGLLNLLQAPQGWLASHLHMSTVSKAVADDDFQWYNHTMDLCLKGQSGLIWLYGVTMVSLPANDQAAIRSLCHVPSRAMFMGELKSTSCAGFIYSIGIIRMANSLTVLFLWYSLTYLIWSIFVYFQWIIWFCSTAFSCRFSCKHLWCITILILSYFFSTFNT